MWWNKSSEKSSGNKAPGKTNAAKVPAPRKALMMALEPRFMFDGAVAATHAELTHHVFAEAEHLGALDHARPVQAAQAAAAPSGPAVVFVDSRVSDPASLLKGVAAGTEIVYLNSSQDGLQQMASYLAAHPEVGSVEIIAHGNDGELLLGDTNLTSANIDSYAQELGNIGSNLKAGADILIYACGTASDATGKSFVDTFSQLTGHAVAASTTTVGLNGTWDLGFETGDISAVPVLSAASEAAYDYDLQTILVTSGADSGSGSLRAAITTADGESGDVIIFNGVSLVTLSSGALDITSSMTIESDAAGDGSSSAQVTINGGLKTGVFSITGGTVTLNGLTITDGMAAGNGGGFGALNAKAVAGGIYVSGSTTKVYLGNIKVQNNYATGGGGGGSGSGYSYGGGGGSSISGTGGSGGAYNGSIAGGAGSSGTGGTGGNNGFSAQSGGGGTSSAGGTGGRANGGFVAGGSGGHIGNISGGGGGSGGSQGANGGNGGLAAGGIYVGKGASVYAFNATFTHNYGAGGGGGGGYGGTGGTGGAAAGAVLLGATGHFSYQHSSTSFSNNNYAAGAGGNSFNNGTASSGASNSSSDIGNTGSSSDLTSTWAPTTVSSVSAVNGTYHDGQTIQFTVNFSNAVTVSGTPELPFTLTTGGQVEANYVSGSGTSALVFDYTVVAGEQAASGITVGSSLNLNNGTIIDSHNGNTSLTLNNVGNTSNVIVQAISPTVVSIAPSGSNPNGGGSESFTVTFSEAVSGVTASNFSLATSGVTYSSIGTPSTSDGGLEWTVTASGASGYGTLELDMSSATGVTDTYSNPLSLPSGGFTHSTEPSADTPVTVHTTPVLSVVSANGGFTEANPYTQNQALVIDSGITVSDQSGGTITTATITITNAQTGDLLNFVSSASTGDIAVQSNSGGVLVLASAGGASITDWKSALESVTFNNDVPSPNTSVTRNVTFSVVDSNSTVSNTLSESVTVTHTAQSPTLSITGSTVDASNLNGVVVDSSATVAETDNTPVTQVVVSIGSGFQSGDSLSFTPSAEVSGSYNLSTGVLTMTGSSATTAEWNTALQSIHFSTSSSTLGDRTISFTATNSASESTTASATDTVDLAMHFTTTGGNNTYTEGNPYTDVTPVTVDSGLALADSGSISSATVTISGGTYHSGEDVLSLASGSYGGITASFNSSTGVLTLSASGSPTVADWASALQAVSYADTAASPTTGTRSVTFSVTDSSSLTATSIDTVIVQATAQTPSLTTSGSTVDLAAHSGLSVTVDGSVTVSEADSTQVDSVVVSISSGFLSGDSLAFTNTSAITGSYDSTTGVLTLTSSTATTAQWSTALQSIQFSTTASTGDRTITFAATNAASETASGTDTVDVTPPPPALGPTGSTVTFTESDNYLDNTAVTVDSSLTLTTATGGSTEMTGATVTLTNAKTGDSLGFTNPSPGGATYGNISASYDSGTGVLTLNSSGNTATAAQWQAALDAVTFNNSAALPDQTARNVTFSVTDANGLSGSVSETVDVVHTAQIPVVGASSGATSYVANASPVVIDSGITVTEADGTALSQVVITVTTNVQAGDVLGFVNDGATMGNISGVYNAGTHTLTLSSATNSASLAQWDSAIESVMFSTSGTAADRSVTFVAVNSASESSSTASKAVDVTPPPPRLGAGSGNGGFTEANPYTNNVAMPIDTGITLTPGGSTEITSATVTLTNAQTGDVLAFSSGGNTANFGNITGSYNSGVLTLSSAGDTATSTQWAAALDAVTYDSTVASPNTATTRDVTFSVTDSNSLTSNVLNETVNVTHTDQSPVVTTTSGASNYTIGGSAVAVDAGVTVAESDNTPLSSVTVVISSGAQTGDVLTFTNNPSTMGNIAGSFSGTTLTLSSSGSSATLADWVAALDSVQFSGATQPGNRTITFTATNSGAESNLTAATKTVDVSVAAVPADVTSVAMPAAGVYTTGQSFNISVDFNEAVTVSTVDGVPRLSFTLDNGQTAYATYQSGSGTPSLTFTYTVAQGALETTGLVLGGSIDVHGGAINDPTGNMAGLTLSDVASGSHVLIDGTSPAVSSIDTVGSSITDANSVTYTVTFNEAVTGINAGDFSLAETGTVKGSIASVTPVGTDGTTYTVTVDNVSGVGTLGLNLSAGSGVADKAGTPVPGYSSGEVYTVDHDSIVISVGVPVVGTYGTGQTVSFDVTFTEAVTVNTTGGVPSITLTLENGTTVQATYVSGSGSDTLVFSYTVAAGIKAQGITVGSSIAANGASLTAADGDAVSMTLAGIGSTIGVDVGDAGSSSGGSGTGTGTGTTGGTGRGILPGLDGQQQVTAANPFIWVVPQGASAGQSSTASGDPTTGQDNWAPAPLATQQATTPAAASENTVGVSGYTGASPTQAEQIVKPAAVALPALGGSSSDQSDLLNWKPPGRTEVQSYDVGVAAPSLPTQTDKAVAEAAASRQAPVSRLADFAHLYPLGRHQATHEAAVVPSHVLPAPSHNGKASLAQQFSRYGKAAQEREKAALMHTAKAAGQRRA